MPKIVDPLIRIAKELANLSVEDAARAVAISKEFRAMDFRPQAGTEARPAAPAPTVKRRGRKPGSKNKKTKEKAELDKQFPKVEHTDSGVAQ